MGVVSASGKRPRRTLFWAAGILLAALVATRAISAFTVAANWDEFALLHRADLTAETGILHSGGRPGLAVLVLLPFVADCGDEIQVVRHARLLWLAFTLAYLGGVAVLAAQLQPDPGRRRSDALWAVALLAAVPAFLEWSLQVRSDQLALACGIWGAVALLASRRRLAFAPLAGLLFALGFLASQKVLYLLALAGLLAAGALWLDRELRPRRELLRGLLCAGVGLALVAGFAALLDGLVEVPERHGSQATLSAQSVSRGLSIFDFYRQTLGFSQYVEMLPTLVPHAVLLLALVAATVRSRRRRGADVAPLALAWAVLAGGAAVAAFHAAAFAYFWMTLGLFPALAFALARRPLAELLPSPRTRLAAGSALGLALALPAVAQAGFLLRDSQAVQRETFAFVHRNLAPTDVGFHPESGLFCQQGGPPIQTHFSQTIYRHFEGRRRARNTAKMIDTFRSEPIKFMVQSFRLNQFPVELRRFWAENYQPYRASVFLAGRELRGAPGAPLDFELIVPGRYRWLPFAEPDGIRIDGLEVAPGASVELEAGPHTAGFGSEAAGILVLAVDDPPGPAPLAFYKAY